MGTVETRKLCAGDFWNLDRETAKFLSIHEIDGNRFRLSYKVGDSLYNEIVPGDFMWFEIWRPAILKTPNEVLEMFETLVKWCG